VPTAIIGVGKIGTAVASHLTAGGETVILAARSESNTQQLAAELGSRASAASVPDAIDQADAVVLAVWLDPMKEVLEQHGALLDGKVVIDPSNPIAANDDGGFSRTLPDGVSSGSVIAGMLPPGAHYVKAFGTIGADALADSANRSPERVALFYATDDELAASVAARLISAAGFDPVKIGGVDQTIRIGVFGDLHQLGGLNGRLLSGVEARAAINAPAQA
jgi:8-hydroxy-5-deazaflavin:NADPH oxidoreductase